MRSDGAGPTALQSQGYVLSTILCGLEREVIRFDVLEVSKSCVRQALGAAGRQVQRHGTHEYAVGDQLTHQFSEFFVLELLIDNGEKAGYPTRTELTPGTRR